MTDYGQKMMELLIQKKNSVTPSAASKAKSNPPTDSHGRLTGLKNNNIPVPHAADPIRNPEDIKHIQEYFLRKNEIRNYALFNLGICLGLRIGDLLSLHFSDLMNSKTSFKQYIEIYEDKTNKLNRLYITPMIVSTMRLYIGYLDETEGFRMTDYLFKSRKTRWSEYSDEQQSPLTPQAVHTILKRMANDLGLQGNISTHTLRKTFSYWSLKLNQGDTESLYTLQSALNHSDTRTTLKYAGITQENVDHLRSDVSNFFQVESENTPSHPLQLAQKPQFDPYKLQNVKLPFQNRRGLQSVLDPSTSIRDNGSLKTPLCPTQNTGFDAVKNERSTNFQYLETATGIPSHILENPRKYLAEIKQMLQEKKITDEQATIILQRMDETK